VLQYDDELSVLLYAFGLLKLHISSVALCAASKWSLVVGLTLCSCRVAACIVKQLEAHLGLIGAAAVEQCCNSLKGQHPLVRIRVTMGLSGSSSVFPEEKTRGEDQLE
jgi:hypothetical protein